MRAVEGWEGGVGSDPPPSPCRAIAAAETRQGCPLQRLQISVSFHGPARRKPGRAVRFLHRPCMNRLSRLYSRYGSDPYTIRTSAACSTTKPRHRPLLPTPTPPPSVYAYSRSAARASATADHTTNNLGTRVAADVFDPHTNRLSRVYSRYLGTRGAADATRAAPAAGRWPGRRRAESDSRGASLPAGII